MSSSSSEPLYTNGHTVMVKSGAARLRDLQNSVKAYISQLTAAFPQDNYGSVTFKCNVVANVRGQIFGYSYVWFSDKRVANIIVGLNPDGSKRVETYPDPNFVAPTEPRPNEDEDDDDEEDDDEPIVIGKATSMKSPMKWGDMSVSRAERVARRKAANDRKYNAPMLERKLPPICTLPSFTYDAEQIEMAKQLLIDNMKAEMEATGCAQRDIIVPSTGAFICSLASVKNVKNSDVIPGCIGCSEAPKWVTAEILRPFFERFSTHTDPITVKGIETTYPLFTITSREGVSRLGQPCNKIQVQFSKVGNSIHDSSFALHFTRKFELEHPGDLLERDQALAEGKEGAAELPVRSCLLIFDHWKRNPERRDRNTHSRPFTHSDTRFPSSATSPSSTGIVIAPNIRYHNK